MKNKLVLWALIILIGSIVTALLLLNRRNYKEAPRVKLKTFVEIDSLRDLDSNKYFKRINGITASNNKLYVSDSDVGRVIVFDSNLKLLKIFGKNGQGPGEFIFPCCINVTNDKIFVGDAARQDIQAFDLTGNYLSKITAKISANFQYSANTYNQFILSDAANNNLIKIEDINGNIIKQFGALISGESKNRNSAIHIVSDEEGNIYTCFYELPVMRKYSKEGVFIWEKDLRTLENINRNYESILESRKEQPYAIRGMIGGLAYNNGCVYVSALETERNNKNRKIIINVNSKSGEITSIYWHENEMLMYNFVAAGDKCFYYADLWNNKITKAIYE